MDTERTWTSKHRFARVAPRKARLVAGLVRGRSCADALEQLQFMHKRTARFFEAVVKSAMVSADEQEADTSRLFVKEARVDGGPYYRRWRAKDRGRVHPIAKRTSHIIVTLAEA